MPIWSASNTGSISESISLVGLMVHIAARPRAHKPNALSFDRRGTWSLYLSLAEPLKVVGGI